jgi:hypothetical protein
MDQLFNAGDLVRSTSNGQIYVIQEFTRLYETLGPSYIARHIDGSATVLLSPAELRPLEALEVLAVAGQIERQMGFLREALVRLRGS